MDCDALTEVGLSVWLFFEKVTNLFEAFLVYDGWMTEEPNDLVI